MMQGFTQSAPIFTVKKMEFWHFSGLQKRQFSIPFKFYGELGVEVPGVTSEVSKGSRSIWPNCAYVINICMPAFQFQWAGTGALPLKRCFKYTG